MQVGKYFEMKEAIDVFYMNKNMNKDIQWWQEQIRQTLFYLLE